MITPEELLGMQARAQRWNEMNSGTKYRSRGGTDLMRKIVTDDMPKLISEVLQLQVNNAAAESICRAAEDHGGPQGELAYDIREALTNHGKEENGTANQVHG